MNLMIDMPEMTISTDNVNIELVEKPRRLDIKSLRKFMLVFGLLSTIFNYIMFGKFYFLFHSDTTYLRTSWFFESIVSASMVILIIRTRKPFFKSRPRKHLLITSLSSMYIAFILPYSPIAQIFGFREISFFIFVCNNLIVIVYIIIAEIFKKIFYSKIKF